MYKFRKTVCIIGLILSIALIVMGVLTPIPDKKISTYSYSSNGYTEYVGGDAYNIQIEASLRGGEIAGGTTARAVYISFGIVLLFLSLVFDSMNIKPSTNTNFANIKNVEKTNHANEIKTTLITEKPIEAETIEVSKKTWKCKCGFENPEHADSCRSCGTYK